MATIEARDLPLAGCKEITVPTFSDERGEFCETWNKEVWRAAGIDLSFVQANQSRSVRGVLRGLHYQLAPFAQAKVIRVLSGAVFDVAVDLRRSSPTFGKWLGLTITASNARQLFIPEGFAHGFLALEEDTTIAYQVSAGYRTSYDRAIRFDDPALGIAWPQLPEPYILSDKDRNAPLLENAEVFA